MRFFRNHDDDKIIAGILEGGSKRILSEKELYNRFLYFIDKAVREHKITREDATSAYHEAFMSVVTSIVEFKYKGLASLKTFTSKIFYHKCIDIIRGTKTDIIDELSEDHENRLPVDVSTIINPIMAKYYDQIINTGLQTIGSKCKEILEYFENGYKDKEIAEMMGFSSEDVAKTTRHRCMRRLKDNIGLINYE